MSADNQPITDPTSTMFHLSENLTDTQQHDVSSLLKLLPTRHPKSDDDIEVEQSTLNIRGFVDGRGLACPMPLLKTKVALRDVAVDESLYVVATDPNSQADITAFCRQSQQSQTSDYLDLVINDVTNQPPSDGTSLQRFDTIYHFIITKTDSN